MDNLNQYFDEPIINYDFEGFPGPIDIPARDLELPVGQPDHIFSANLRTQYDTGMPTNSQLSLSTADSIADNYANMAQNRSEKERVLLSNQNKIFNIVNAKLNAKFLETESALSLTPQTETSIEILESHRVILESQKSLISRKSNKLADIIGNLGENSNLFDHFLEFESKFNEVDTKIALYIHKVRNCIAKFRKDTDISRKARQG